MITKLGTELAGAAQRAWDEGFNRPVPYINRLAIFAKNNPDWAQGVMRSADKPAPSKSKYIGAPTAIGTGLGGALGVGLHALDNGSLRGWKPAAAIGAGLGAVTTAGLAGLGYRDRKRAHLKDKQFGTLMKALHAKPGLIDRLSTPPIV